MAEPFGAAPSQADLDDLLAAVANGDAGAFADLYAQISPAAFGLAIRVIGDRHLAEEVLQEVFLHIWRNASTFDADRGAAKGWILMLTHRRSVDRVRAVQSARERDIADAARVAATPGGDTATEAELRIDGQPVGVLQALNPTRDAFDRADAEALLVPRLQFTCIEVAREAEGLGQEASVYALSERLGELRKELDGATKSSQEAQALRVLRQIGKLPVPSREILVNSRCHLALKRTTHSTSEKASSLAAGLLRRWKAALVMSSLASTTWRKARMWSGVVPQQPPIICVPPLKRSGRNLAISSGFCE